VKCNSYAYENVVVMVRNGSRVAVSTRGLVVVVVLASATWVAAPFGLQTRGPGAPRPATSGRPPTENRRSLVVARAKSSHPDDDDAAPELADDVRDFRARLIAREKSGALEGTAATTAPTEPTASDDARTQAAAAAATATSGAWAYETPLLEQGSVLLGGLEQSFGFALRQQYFHKCVVVLVQHDDQFTKGLIVNRPSRRTLDGWEVWLGGDVCEGGVFAADEADGDSTRSSSSSEASSSPFGGFSVLAGKPLDVECLTALDGVSDEDGFTKVVKGIRRCSFDTAKRLVAEGRARREDFWVFVGYAGWSPQQYVRSALKARGC